MFHFLIDEADVIRPWSHLTAWNRLRELDLVTMRFSNVRTLLKVVGPQLLNLTLEMDDEQGSGSEIVHIARHCPELRSIRLLIGDKILRGEMTLHFGTQFFRHLERLTVEGSVHLHGFAFLWGHCRNLTYLRIGKSQKLRSLYGIIRPVNLCLCIYFFHISLRWGSENSP